KEKDRTPAMKELLKTNDSIASIKNETLRQRFPELVPAADSLEAAIKKRTAERPAALPQLSVALDVTPDPAPHQVLKRGNYADPLRPAPPRVPALFGTVPVLGSIVSSSNNAVASSASRSSSGRRLAFANWVVSAQNPVFARLMVNRIWQGHFGSGLV